MTEIAVVSQRHSHSYTHTHTLKTAEAKRPLGEAVLKPALGSSVLSGDVRGLL